MPVRVGESFVGALRPAEGELDRPEQLVLEAVGQGLVERLVGGAEGGEGDAEVLGSLGRAVGDLLAGIRGAVGHLRCIAAGRWANRPPSVSESGAFAI
ncbi:MAG TPA: hypothetical protein VGI83_09145 [Gemmatimonadales bacterium]